MIRLICEVWDGRYDFWMTLQNIIYPVEENISQVLVIIGPLSALKYSDPMRFLLDLSIYKHHALSHAASFRAVHSYKLVLAVPVRNFRTSERKRITHGWTT